MNNYCITLIYNALQIQSTSKIFQDVARNVSTIEMTPYKSLLPFQGVGCGCTFG